MVGRDANEYFIGRESEIASYEEWLNRSDGPWILYFHDAFADAEKKGGVGKTWLLRECRALTRKLYPDKVIVPVDFFNVEDRNCIVIAERVIRQLKAVHPHWSPDVSDALLLEYRKNIKTDAIDSSLEKRLANALVSDLCSLDEQLEKTGRYLLLFYDTFELIERNPVVALLNPTDKFPENYQFAHIGVVMAGRNELPLNDPDSYWYGRQEEVLQIPLGPFSLEEMVAYINQGGRSILAPHSPEMRQLYERTEGRPILIGLVADIVNRQVLTLADLLHVSPPAFEEYIVSHISSLEEPISWAILFMAHACHRFNENILNWMLQQSYLSTNIPSVRYQSLLQELPYLSFVRHSSSGDDFVLHDEMRRLVIRYCWEQQDPQKENRREISNCMIKYYEQVLTHKENKHMLQSYTVEMLYHKLFFSLDAGLQFFEQVFDKALNMWLRPFARSLLQETQRFTSSLLTEQLYSLTMQEAKLLLREEQPGRALTNYEYLEKESDRGWFDNNRSRIYSGLANCFLSLGNYSKAYEIVDKSLPIEPDESRQAELLEMLGYIDQHHGEFDAAITHYKQALAIYKQLGNRREYADKVNSLGNLYRSWGKMEEALRYCQVALQIREELFAQGEAGELQKGLSLSTIGRIYLENNDIFQAEKYFREASLIFQSAGYRTGIARTHNRLGQIEEMKGNFAGAMKHFALAHEIALSIDAQEERITSLNKQGSVFIHQGQLSKARECFELAIELSEQTEDSLQQVEALIDLAEVFENLNMHTESQRSLDKGMHIAKKDNYFSLLGKAENFQGALSYRRQDYEAAFSHFVKACHYMALFNSLRYHEAIRSLIEHLLQVPENSRPAILDMIRAYWSENGLEKPYPELIQACQEVEGLVF